MTGAQNVSEHHSRIIDQHELRSNPALITELRAHPGENIERRYAPLKKVEVRASENGNGYQAVGLAAVFDDMSENLGGFREVIKRGAFRKVLDTNPDVRFLFNHDPNLPLARTTAGNLSLREVGNGLEYIADVVPTTTANDLRQLMEAGVVNQSSFAFRLAPGGDSWDEDPDTGGLIRTISEFSALLDVSAVTYPAYPTTTSGVRAHDLSIVISSDADELNVTQSRSEQLQGADAEEPTQQADRDEKRAHVEDTNALVDGISAAEAWARVSARAVALRA